jgi:hypothetical protein
MVMSTPPARRSKTVAKDPAVKEAEANAEVASEDRSSDTKCDNHPGRKGRNFTGGGSYSINLCDECTPPWFKDESPAL